MPHFVPVKGLKRGGVAAAYEIQPLYDDLGLDGSGQTVAVVSWDTFNDGDIVAFDASTRTVGPAVQRFRFPGSATSPGPAQDEVDLDIEIIRTIAPQAQIVNYEACYGTSLGTIVQKIVDDGLAQIISISWGLCETNGRPSVTGADEVALTNAFTAGVSVFVASGDDGAYDCRRNPARRAGQGKDRDYTVTVDYSASSPHAIGVGGTYLSTAIDGSYVSEAGWEDPFSGYGGGGGVSGVFDRPAWQVGMGEATNPSGKRQVPDVAGPADGSSGIYIIKALDGCDAQQPTCWEESLANGTSQATPFWSGTMALTAQLAAQQGLGRIGPLAPRLWRLANSPAYLDLFHDVARGGNLLYPATPGWDYSTGWGSPRVSALAQAIIADIKAHPIADQ